MLGEPNSDTDDDVVAADTAHAATPVTGATAAPKPPTPANAAERQAHLEQLRELEAMLDEERRQTQKLHLTLEQEHAAHNTKAREAGRITQQ